MHWIYWLIFILTGAVIGSFLNVVIYRGPTLWGLVGDDKRVRGNFLSPRSHCPSCKAPIPAWRLIPIISFIVQRGNCAQCQSRIPMRYPIVEFLGMAIAIAAVLIYGADVKALWFMLYGWTLLALGGIDLETGFLPDILTIPLIVSGLIANFCGQFVNIENAMLGAVLGYVSFWLIGAAFQKLRGQEGLGQGDTKLLAAIGAWGGAAILPIVVLMAAVTTLAAIMAAKVMGKDIQSHTQIPFGPALCVVGIGVFQIDRLLMF